MKKLLVELRRNECQEQAVYVTNLGIIATTESVETTKLGTTATWPLLGYHGSTVPT